MEGKRICRKKKRLALAFACINFFFYIFFIDDKTLICQKKTKTSIFHFYKKNIKKHA